MVSVSALRTILGLFSSILKLFIFTSCNGLSVAISLALALTIALSIGFSYNFNMDWNSNDTYNSQDPTILNNYGPIDRGIAPYFNETQYNSNNATTLPYNFTIAVENITTNENQNHSSIFDDMQYTKAYISSVNDTYYTTGVQVENSTLNNSYFSDDSSEYITELQAVNDNLDNKDFLNDTSDYTAEVRNENTALNSTYFFSADASNRKLEEKSGILTAITNLANDSVYVDSETNAAEHYARDHDPTQRPIYANIIGKNDAISNNIKPDHIPKLSKHPSDDMFIKLNYNNNKTIIDSNQYAGQPVKTPNHINMDFEIKFAQDDVLEKTQNNQTADSIDIYSPKELSKSNFDLLARNHTNGSQDSLNLNSLKRNVAVYKGPYTVFCEDYCDLKNLDILFFPQQNYEANIRNGNNVRGCLKKLKLDDSIRYMQPSEIKKLKRPFHPSQCMYFLRGSCRKLRHFLEFVLSGEATTLSNTYPLKEYLSILKTEYDEKYKIAQNFINNLNLNLISKVDKRDQSFSFIDATDNNLTRQFQNKNYMYPIRNTPEQSIFAYGSQVLDLMKFINNYPVGLEVLKTWKKSPFGPEIVDLVFKKGPIVFINYIEDMIFRPCSKISLLTPLFHSWNYAYSDLSVGFRFVFVNMASDPSNDFKQKINAFSRRLRGIIQAHSANSCYETEKFCLVFKFLEIFYTDVSEEELISPISSPEVSVNYSSAIEDQNMTKRENLSDRRFVVFVKHDLQEKQFMFWFFRVHPNLKPYVE